MSPEVRRLYGQLADLLDYPSFVPTDELRECQSLLATVDPKAAALLDGFAAHIESATTGSLQEDYTRTFDLEATWHPYVGYHLFGETYQRSVFLVALKEAYEHFGFADDSELPDHLPIVLRFLSVCDTQQVADELVVEAVLPMLVKVAKKKDGDAGESGDAEASKKQEDQGPEPYKQVLDALTSLLFELYPEGPQFDPEEMQSSDEISVSLRTS